MIEKIFIQSKTGNKISCLLSLPNDKRNTIVIMCHGFLSGKEDPFIKAMMSKLYEDGITSISFDFSGHGESEGALEDITITNGLKDLESVIEAIKAYPIDFQNTVLYGRSYGGNIALLYAGKHQNIKGLVLNSPSIDCLEMEESVLSAVELKQWGEDGYRYKQAGQKKIKVNYTFYQDIQKVETYEVAKRLKVETLIIHGDQDQVVPISQSEKLTSMSDYITLKKVKGAGHNFKSMVDYADSFDLTIAYIKSRLLDQ